jgi:hypothetical protein
VKEEPTPPVADTSEDTKAAATPPTPQPPPPEDAEMGELKNPFRKK